MGRVERDREIARRRHRRNKLQKLRKQFAAASNKSQKQAIVEKVQRISPLVDLENEASADCPPSGLVQSTVGKGETTFAALSGSQAVKTNPSVWPSTTSRDPSGNSPASSLLASPFWMRCWMTRFSGRAP